MLAVLRLALGCHFLYEGIWKIRHADLFVGETEGFLSGARGPLAGFFYAMVPDIDGRQRLVGDLAEIDSKDTDGKSAKSCKLAQSWDGLRQKFVDFYRPTPAKETDAKTAGDKNVDVKKLHEQLTEEAKKVYNRHVKGLNEFVKENGDKINAHFESLKRFEDGRKTDPHTMFQTQRRWDEMQDLRKEARGWIADLDSREYALKGDLTDLLKKDRKPELEKVQEAVKKEKEAEVKKAEVAATKSDAAATKAQTAEKSKEKAAGPGKGIAEAEVVLVDFSPLAKDRAVTGAFAASTNPLQWKRIEQLAFLLTWSLFGIGLCLVLGLFTRPAALAGAGFMLFVVLSQPSYPGVYPLDPPQLGHALLINKDFVEMVALLVIASTSLGRWTGLDFFIHRIFIQPYCCAGSNETTTERRLA